MSLLRTAVRASVATRVVGSTHRRQQQRWAAQDAQAAQTVQAPQSSQLPEQSSMLDQLAQLGSLRDSGVLSEAEFQVQKQRILAAG